MVLWVVSRANGLPKNIFIGICHGIIMMKCFVFLLLCWYLPLAAAGDTSEAAPAKESGDASDNGCATGPAFDGAWKELKTAILSNDRNSLARFVIYPLRTVTLNGKRVSIKSRAEFVARYDELIDDRFRESISRDGFFCNSYGIAVANGLLWLSYDNQGTSKEEGPLKIASINSSSADKTLGMECITLKHRILVTKAGTNDYTYQSWRTGSPSGEQPELTIKGGHYDCLGTGSCGICTWTFTRGDYSFQVSDSFGCLIEPPSNAIGFLEVLRKGERVSLQWCVD